MVKFEYKSLKNQNSSAFCLKYNILVSNLSELIFSLKFEILFSHILFMNLFFFLYKIIHLKPL